MLLGTVSHPGGDVPTQDALDGAGVRVPEHLERELKVSEASEEVETLSGFLHNGVQVMSP